MTRPSLPALLLLGLFLPRLALAQDDSEAGLFTEARQLPLVSQSLAVLVDGDEATLHLSQVFVNEGAALGQADYQLHLPDGATVEGFGFWNQDRYLAAALQTRDEARAAHTKAASQGRATALLEREGSIHSFSVFPVEAGSLKQVETTLRLPIEVEGGRRELRLPVDRFLGQAGPTSTVTVRLATDRPLADVGLSLVGGSEVDVRRLSQDEHGALLATSTRQPLVLHWQEQAPALDLWARRVDTPDGVGLSLRVGLNGGVDDSLGALPWKRLVVIVDASASMRRRGHAVDQVLAQLRERLRDRLRDRLSESSGPLLTVRSAADGRRFTGLPQQPGHTTSWEDLQGLIQAEGCGGETRCLVLTDAQLPGIAQAETAPASLLVLADAQEAAFFSQQIPAQAAVFQPGVDPDARLRALVDQAVLPVLEIDRLSVGDRNITPLGAGPWRVAEGGLLRMSALFEPVPGSTLTIEAHLNGVPLTRTLPLPDITGQAAERRVRRSVYRELLASWMRSWKQQPVEDLKTRITEVSLREGIPTAFTSLQVDDPQLSLVAIKPGDPTLRVDGAPGVTDVVAWYPFGEQRRLVREKSQFSDRFLVPRWWPERAYRVETFSRRADGQVEQKGTWYVLDEATPEARLSLVGDELVVNTGEQTPEIGAVEVHAPGRVWRLALDQSSPRIQAGSWRLPLADLPGAFTVVVRDRAGNVGRWPATVQDHVLTLAPQARERSRVPAAPLAASLPQEHPSLQAGNDTMRVDGRQAVVHLADRSLHFDAGGLGLRSLRLTAAAELGDRLLLGTAGGDLLDVRCVSGDCSATRLDSARLDTGHLDHPITGIAALGDGRALVGILGVGLLELQPDASDLADSALRVGSRFITGVATAPDGDVLIATAYNGLWRLSDGAGRALRTRFPHDHVSGLRVPGGLLDAGSGSGPLLDVEIDSGYGRFLRLSRDRFAYRDAGLNALDAGSPGLTDLVRVGERTFVAGFDSGLWELGPEGELLELGLTLTVDEARVNSLAVFGDRLYLGTEGGLLSVDPDRPEAGLERILPGAVHDLAVGPHGLAVASSSGLFVLSDGLRRVDLDGPLAQPLLGTGRYLSVAWQGQDLYAGTLDGLLHFDAVGKGFVASAITVADGFDAGWVTALRSDGDTLFVGTYADGLWTVDEGGVSRILALAEQWVPPHALRFIGDELWVGGLGMAPVRIDRDGRAVAVPLPVRDVNAVLPGPDGGLLVASSDGLVVIDAKAVARRERGSSGSRRRSARGEQRRSGRD